MIDGSTCRRFPLSSKATLDAGHWQGTSLRIVGMAVLVFAKPHRTRTNCPRFVRFHELQTIHLTNTARFVDSNVIWHGSERYDSPSPLDGGAGDDRSDHPFGPIGG